MEYSKNMPCIISVAIGGHYIVSLDRLERSLQYHGYAGKTMFWRDYPTGCPAHDGEGQYNFKIYAFSEAFKKGHKIVLWLDSSFYAIKDVSPIFDYISDNGLYLFKSGYPLSATATDKLLDGQPRESFVDVPEFATGAVGINIDNPEGSSFFFMWHSAMQAGLFGGNRVHDLKDSAHPLFKFSRQDQSAASLILHSMKKTTSGEDKNWVSYYPTETKDTIFFIKGI